MDNRLKYAFTLIELLVVIAIVGILSGLIIVGMNYSIQSANIAKAQVFSASLRDSLLANLVSEWKFDGSGVADGGVATNAYLQDTWGSYSCTIHGTPLVYSSSNCIYGSCIKFNGVGDYLNCGGPNFNDNITVSAWFNSNSANLLQIIFVKWSYQALDLYIGSNQLMGAAVTNDGVTNHWFFGSGGTINNNTWYLGTITFKSSTGAFLYLNGTKVATIATDGYPIRSSVTSAWIGRYNYTPERYFSGLIDDIRIYKDAIPAYQIKEQYFAGLNHLVANQVMTKQEYSDKIYNLQESLAKN